VLNHEDRLLRFGAELVFAICEMKTVEIVILTKAKTRVLSRYYEDRIPAALG
jgi:predicted site-specific integrase-resolvase